MDSLHALLALLAVPSDFGKSERAELFEAAPDDGDVANWKACAVEALAHLLRLLQRDRNAGGFDAQTCSEVAFRVTAFTGSDPWTTPAGRASAEEIISVLAPSQSIVVDILSAEVRPIFKANPHPKLHADTGRPLPRAAGGSVAAYDHFETQNWKAHPGVTRTLRWCISRCEMSTWEKAWHLIVPPTMTLLDDYDASWKLIGVDAARGMILSAPPELLTRTGVDNLLFTSLHTALTSVRDPLSAELIRAALPARLALIAHCTAPGSEARGARLFELLGDGVIGTIWAYARDPAVLRASYECLPPVVDALGIGCARFLKALIPQLLHAIALPPPGVDPLLGSAELRAPAIRALRAVVDACAVRMHRWKGTILDGVARCWTQIADTESFSALADTGREETKAELLAVCDALALACPSVVQDEYAELARLDDMFIPLLKMNQRDE